MLKTKHFIVKKSKIAGLGLFARRTLFNGESLGHVAIRRIEKDNHAHCCWFRIKRGKIVSEKTVGSKWEPFLFTNIFAYMNHANKPNCVFIEGMMQMYSVKKIRKGTELTWHYGDDWEKP